MCVEISRGLPILSSRAAPAIIPMTFPAISFCTRRRRNAEQRCPAERKADESTSSAACSGNALASITITLMPPVSAISGTIGPSFAASARLICCATSVEPVKTTPATRGSSVKAAPVLPSPCASKRAFSGMPDSWSSATASAAIRGVCSAGFATTVFPAASAAVTWPMKIASGKFQGEIATNGPRPVSRKVFRSPAGPGSGASCANRRRASEA